MGTQEAYGFERKWWLDLDLTSGSMPDGTHVDNQTPEPSLYISTASITSNTGKIQIPRLGFDFGTDEVWSWVFMLPQGYSSGGTLYLTWNAVATTGDVIWKAATKIYTASTDLAAAFNAADLFSASTVAGTSLRFVSTSKALTMTDAAGGLFMALLIGRDANNASDTMSGDAFLVGAQFECVVA
jgi:hypothetical protein